jgi:hypothetical protein
LVLGGRVRGEGRWHMRFHYRGCIEAQIKRIRRRGGRRIEKVVNYSFCRARQ